MEIFKFKKFLNISYGFNQVFGGKDLPMKSQKYLNDDNFMAVLNQLGAQEKEKGIKGVSGITDKASDLVDYIQFNQNASREFLDVQNKMFTKICK